jgi:hypothetical protein
MPRLEVPMGGGFGKYGDAKHKAQIRKNRLKPPALISYSSISRLNFLNLRDFWKR